MARQRNLQAFIQYYSEEIEVGLRKSIIKPLHAQWLVNIYTYFTSASHGRDIIFKGWKKAGISGLLHRTTTLPSEDPFEHIYTD